MTASEVLDRHYLELRARLLEIAATLDRIERASEADQADERLRQVMEGIEILRSSDSDRAEQIQHLFSRPYDPQWRGTFGL